MQTKLEAAIASLATAFVSYDAAKAEHKETTEALKEAKDLVDVRARSVVEIQAGVDAPTLFDRDTVTITKANVEVDGEEAVVVSEGNGTVREAEYQLGDGTTFTIRAASGYDVDGNPLPAEASADVTLDGATGAPMTMAPDGGPVAYEMTPSAEDPARCVCGFEITSPIGPMFHDDAHARYLSVIEGPEQPEAAARVRKAREKKGDVTAAVGKRATSKAKPKTKAGA